MTAPGPTLAQYAKTTDPATLAAIKHNRAGAKAFYEQCDTFATEHGDNTGEYCASGFAGRYGILSIASTTEPATGRWKKGPSAREWVPYKNNPLFAVMDTIRFDNTPVPGLPALLAGPRNHNGALLMCTPVPFILNGVAYYGSTFTPSAQPEHFDDVDGGCWEEILASDYQAAAETFDAANMDHS